MEDDQVSRLDISWFTDVYKISTIGDGSCFIHAVLKASDPKYQENNSLKYRKLAAKSIRKDLADYLEQETAFKADKEIKKKRKELGYLSKDVKHYINYEKVLDGQFLNLYEQQKIGDAEFTGPDEEEIDFSLEGLQDLFNSKRWLGDEVYGYVSLMLNLDIYIMLEVSKKKKLKYINDTKIDDKPRKSIVIVGDGTHFEVIAIKESKYLQTVFPPGSKFIKAIQDIKLKR